jgi:hypothetical protein
MRPNSGDDDARLSAFSNDSITFLAKQSGRSARKQIQSAGNPTKIATTSHAEVDCASGRRQPGHLAGSGLIVLKSTSVTTKMAAFATAAILVTVLQKSGSKFG